MDLLQDYLVQMHETLQLDILIITTILAPLGGCASESRHTSHVRLAKEDLNRVASAKFELLEADVHHPLVCTAVELDSRRFTWV